MAIDLTSYQGNPAVAGGTAGMGGAATAPFEFKNVNSAVDQMMAYQYDENKTKWMQAQTMATEIARDAAAKMTFTLGDYLPQDTDEVMKRIGDLNSYFTNNPTSVMLMTDRKGKVTNQKEHAEWLRLTDAVNAGIYTSGARKAQTDEVLKQVNSINDPYEKELATRHYETMYKSPFGTGIMLYPNVNIYNIRDLPVESTMVSLAVTDAAGNLVTKGKYSMPHVPATIGQATMMMNQPQNEKMKKTFEDAASIYNQVLKPIKDKYGDAWSGMSIQDKLTKLRSEGNIGGNNLADMVEAYNGYTKQWNDPYVQSQVHTMVKEMNLNDLLSVNDVIGMTASYIKPSTQVGFTDVDYLGLGIQQERLLQGWKGLDLEQQRINVEKIRANAALLNAQSETDPDAYLGIAPLQYITNTLATPYEANAVAQTIPGGDFKGQTGYVINDLTTSANILRYPLEGGGQIIIPDPSNPVFGEKNTYSEYPMIKGWVIPGANNDVNRSRVVIEYKDPQNPGTPKYRDFTPAQLRILAPKIFGGTGESAAKSDIKTTQSYQALTGQTTFDANKLVPVRPATDTSGAPRGRFNQ